MDDLNLVEDAGVNDGNHTFTMNGIEFRTGCRMSTAEGMAKAMAANATFPENLIMDKKDIERSLPKGTYAKLRESRRKRMINQLRLGKCNASALKGATHQIRESNGFPFVEMSDCWTYMQMNGGRDDGSALADAAKLSAKGMAPKNLVVGDKKLVFPEDVYRKNQVTKEMLDAANKAAVNFTSHELYIVPDKWDLFVPVVATAVARGFPIIFAWDVTSAGYNLKNGYVQNGHGMGNHANFIHSGEWVGGTELVHLDDQNSWGTDWGDGGFGKFTMESFFRCRKNHLFYVMTSMNVDPGSEI